MKKEKKERERDEETRVEARKGKHPMKAKQ